MSCMSPSIDASPAVAEIQALSEFRYRLRHYLGMSEKICRANGLTSLQYQALLHIFSEDAYSLAAIAEKLQCRLATAAKVLNRCVSLSLIESRVAKENQAKQSLRLSAKGYKLISHLIVLHQQELKQLLVHLPIPQHGKFCTSPVCWKSTD
jgi:DNA-binding MarR family transcriptional regulator